MSQTCKGEQTTEGCVSPNRKMAFPSAPVVTSPRCPRHLLESVVPLASFVVRLWAKPDVVAVIKSASAVMQQSAARSNFVFIEVLCPYKIGRASCRERVCQYV